MQTFNKKKAAFYNKFFKYFAIIIVDNFYCSESPSRSCNRILKEIESGEKREHLNFSVADPDPGSGIGCFLTPGCGIRDPGWEKVSIRVRDPG